MTTLARGQTVNAQDAPLLPFYSITPENLPTEDLPAGMLMDPYALSFQIFDLTTDANRLSPVQVYPATPGDKHSVDLSENSPDRLGKGRFAAAYTVPVNAPVGRYEIRWFWRMTQASSELRARKAFEVVAGGADILEGGPAYAMVCELREEGIPATGPGSVSDARMQATILLASKFVETATGRFFEPRHVTHEVNGTGARAIILGDPIIGVESVAITTTPYNNADLVADPSLYRVNNRHLRGVMQPDDREVPKIEFVHTEDLLGVGFYRTISYSLRSLQFVGGVQNVSVKGLFGYTEPDRSPWGATPALIRYATKLLVLREMVIFSDVDCREDWRRRWRLTSEKTRDQSYTLANPRWWGGLTEDPEIDSILAQFVRPPAFGAV